MYLSAVCLCLCAALGAAQTRLQERKVGKMTEVFAWRQLTYNIDGTILDRDRASMDGLSTGGTAGTGGIGSTGGTRGTVSTGGIGGTVGTGGTGGIGGTMGTGGTQNRRQRFQRQANFGNFANDYDNNRNNQRNQNRNRNPQTNFQGYNQTENRVTTRRPSTNDESNSFFIQYNNIPMGAEKVGNRLFVTVPRRRYGIPSTLNYLDLSLDMERSPNLRPYPSLREGRSLTSVYRTRADECGRLWMVDTGLLEIPNQPQQVQTPAIVVFDLRTDRQLLRYELQQSDLPANNTPTGLASITVDTTNGCADAFAYIPDLTTFGIIVYSLRENDSWRVSHSYMHFNPLAITLEIAGQRFQWSDGIFSIALSRAGSDGCRTAYFHPMISTQEFAVSTCVLNNRTASSDSDYWTRYSIVGERGTGAQSTMHDMHPNGVMLFADIGRSAVSCWNTFTPLAPDSVAVLANDPEGLSYAADLHVSDGDVWVISNAMPRFSYARLDTNQYNFFIYRGNVEEMITNTVCSTRSRPTSTSTSENNRYN